MKTHLLLLALAGAVLAATNSYAQDAENLNPYAIFGCTPYVAGDKDAGADAEKVFVIENFTANSPVARIEHAPRSGHVRLLDKHGKLLKEKWLKAGENGWPTQDRFAEKYYSISPYAYCAGNPINSIDLNGDSIWYTRHDNTITMHVTAKVINYSSADVNVEKRAAQIAKRLARDYAGPVTIDGQECQMVVDADIQGVESMNDVDGSDHVFAYADRTNEVVEGATSALGGKTMTLYSDASMRSTSHEFGHAAGLIHETVSGVAAIFNVMTQGGHFGSVTSGQRAIMYRQRGNINKYPNSAVMTPGNPYSPRIPYPYMHSRDKRGRPTTGHINQVGLRYNLN